jgi:tetratricopeptide (TPR) repeat protein
MFLGDDDRAGYRAAGNEILARCRDSERRDEVHWAVWTCVLAPDAVNDYRQLVALARRGHELVPDDMPMTQALGAALFRAGQFEEAVEVLAGAESASHPNTTPIYARWFLAMAEHSLGNTDAARQWYDRANAETAQLLAKGPTEPGYEPIPWNRRLTLELLRAEAAEMFGESAENNGE